MQSLKTLIVKLNLFKFNVRKFTTRSTSFTFKNKINSFYKHVHPDILGSTCPSEFRKINETSLQDLNNYIESLGKLNSKFDNKIINFYIKVEDTNEDIGKTNISFSKLSINLEKIQPSLADSFKINLQLK
jgi:hypothetical protein